MFYSKTTQPILPTTDHSQCPAYTPKLIEMQRNRKTWPTGKKKKKSIVTVPHMAQMLANKNSK